MRLAFAKKPSSTTSSSVLFCCSLLRRGYARAADESNVLVLRGDKKVVTVVGTWGGAGSDELVRDTIRSVQPDAVLM